MNHIVEIAADQTIHFYLDMSVYPRTAVLKVLCRWTDRYAIVLEKAERLHVALQPLDKSAFPCKPDTLEDSQTIMNDLVQELLRLEIIAQTSGIRQLLVGRALYATCIEACHEGTPVDERVADSDQGWEADGRRILASWNG